MRFKDRVVLVTGGASGIGLAAALEFRKEGGRVIVTDRDATTLAAAAAKLGDGSLALQSDISDLSATTALMERIAKDYGRIDVLFLNAGIGAFFPIEQMTEENWERILGINLKGPYFAIQKALPLMSSGAAIVLTCSVGHRKALPGNSAYAASKAGLRSLARNLGLELIGRGIRVNCISPGPIDTPITTHSLGLTPEDVDTMRKKINDVVPMGRMGRAEEAAKAALFLASDEASFITGIDLLVDGGLASF
jgi:NAD(P)-dependent dehydrogenase (short-subunit alcohol dehydrogenase family)